MNSQDSPALASIDKTSKPSGGPVPNENSNQFSSLIMATNLCFWAALVLTIILTGVFVGLKGFYYGLGALEGGALVVLDLAIFRWFLSKASPGRSSVPLWKTVVKFYLVSLFNMLICFLVIKFNIGSPFTFLAGLGLFLPAMLLGLIVVTMGFGQSGPKLKAAQSQADTAQLDRSALDQSKPESRDSDSNSAGEK
ncbi:MAG: ATP synthase subunit I [Deltaproteobacteria bacterium]|jgi:hypothetical protein|nr:ATP synthase subunit I [Deltaproteobacteria bacterium]